MSQVWLVNHYDLIISVKSNNGSKRRDKQIFSLFYAISYLLYQYVKGRCIITTSSTRFLKIMIDFIHSSSEDNILLDLSKSIKCFQFQAFQVKVRRRQWHPTPVLLPGKSHGWRSLVGYSPWGRWESDTTERLHFHFSVLCIGEGNGNPLQCSCLENPRDSRAWWAAVYGVAQSRTRLKRLSSSSSKLRFAWSLEDCYLLQGFFLCNCLKIQKQRSGKIRETNEIIQMLII